MSAGGLVSLLAALAAVAIAAPARATGDPGRGLEGTWQSAGYGMVVEITSDRSTGRARLTKFDVTSISCLKSDSLTQLGKADRVVSFGEDDYRELRVRRQGDRLVLRVLGNATDIHLTRLEHSPPCPSTIPRGGRARRLRTFDIFWQTFAEHYPPFEGRPLDWSQRARDRAALVRDNTHRKLSGLLRRTVRRLGDMHTGVSWKGDDHYGARPGTRDSVDAAPIRRAIEARFGTRLTDVIDGDVQYATGLPGGLGYLRITSLSDLGGDGSYPSDLRRFSRALDTVFRQGRRDHWRGLIVDLRLNDGGYDELGLELAGRLTRRPHFAFKKRARELRDPSGFTPFRDVAVHPSRRPGFYGPVALLVSDLTVSAGETATMAILNRKPAPPLIGRGTQGIFSDELERELPAAWSFELSNEDYRTADGTSFEGRGIPVDRGFRTPVFTRRELTRRRDAAIAKAIDHLRSRRSRSPR